MPENEPWIKAYIAPSGLGWIIALVILILCIVAFFGGIVASSGLMLAMIAGLALARLV